MAGAMEEAQGTAAGRAAPPCARWRDLQPGWRERPRRERFRLLSGAAAQAHAWWRAGVDPSLLPAGFLPFGPGAPAPASRAAAASPERLLVALTNWWTESRDTLPPEDCAHFARELLRAEGLGTAARRFFEREIPRRAAQRTRAAAARAHARFLDPLAEFPWTAGRGAWRGVWRPDPRIAAAEAAQLVEAAERSPDAALVKQTSATQLVRSEMAGRAVAIKRHEVRGLLRRLRHAFQPSRARRAYAAARTLDALGLPHAATLGFLERRRHGLPAAAVEVSEWIEGAPNLRTWAIERGGAAGAEGRRAVAESLARLLERLEEAGAYHADLKATNLLVREANGGFEIVPVDLEGLRFGAVWTTGRRVRNLAQLNGSLEGHVAAEERRAFLDRLAARHPGLARPAVRASIERRTARRLRHERRTSCGP